MRNGEGVAGASYSAVPQNAEFAAFDLLPMRVRDALRYAHFKYSALDCFAAISAGLPSEAVLQQIRRMDAELGTRS